MPANYTLLEKITVGAAGASSVTFSGIPQTGYTDLVVKASTRSTNTTANDSDSLNIQFNGDTASNYSRRTLYGDGGATGSSSATTTSMRIGFTDTNGNTSNTFGNAEIYIPNYTGSTQKSVSSDAVVEGNVAQYIYASLNAGLWTGTSAITSITLLIPSYSFLSGSTFYLYGVAKLGTTPAIVPYATGGDTIMTDGTYWYHTFASSGTFTPQKSLSCDYLVVAGGGGGANSDAGGGGAGGLRSTVTATGGGGSLESALSLASGTGYTVTIGAGGAGGTRTVVAANGSNSVFATITSTGGGAGGGSVTAGNYAANSGGSGGGGVAYGTNPGGAGTANQGYAGGDGNSGGGSGGGGGAGAVGGVGTYSVRGNGGNGVATSISGSSVTYAGGGGGGSSSSGTTPGTGGTGGGGAGGGRNTSGTNGTTNLGGGGGAGGDGSTATVGGNGGSGIVIVRYAV